MKYKRIWGIDAGVNGAIAILNSDGGVFHARPFPLLEEVKENHRKRSNKLTRIERYYDLEKFKNLIVAWGGGAYAFLESVHGMPNDGGVQAFKFGDCFGQIKGMLKAMGIEYEMVSPQTWMRAMHHGLPFDISTKQKSRKIIEMTKPEIGRQYEPKQIPDGVADAYLIAEYGRRQLGLRSKLR